MVFPPLPRRHAGDVQPDAHHGADIGDVKRAPVIIAPRKVGGMMPRSLDAGEHFARGIMHENSTRTRAPDVAFDVALHAVGDAALGAGVLIKEPPITQAAVGLHVVHCLLYTSPSPRD